MHAAALTVPASPTEILSLDWNKYRPWVIATGGVDRAVKVWDCRMVKIGGDAGQGQMGAPCETQLLGHEYAVRKIQWSPHRAEMLATASYDMTCRMYVSTSFAQLSVFDADMYSDGIPLLPLGSRNCLISWTLTPSS